jgi:hypothetical protein
MLDHNNHLHYHLLHHHHYHHHHDNNMINHHNYNYHHNIITIMHTIIITILIPYFKNLNLLITSISNCFGGVGDSCFRLISWCWYWYYKWCGQWCCLCYGRSKFNFEIQLWNSTLKKTNQITKTNEKYTIWYSNIIILTR